MSFSCVCLPQASIAFIASREDQLELLSNIISPRRGSILLRLLGLPSLLRRVTPGVRHIRTRSAHAMQVVYYELGTRINMAFRDVFFFLYRKDFRVPLDQRLTSLQENFIPGLSVTALIIFSQQTTITSSFPPKSRLLIAIDTRTPEVSVITVFYSVVKNSQSVRTVSGVVRIL